MSLFTSVCEKHVNMYIHSDYTIKKQKERRESDVANLKLKIASAHSRNVKLSFREIKLLRCVFS